MRQYAPRVGFITAIIELIRGLIVTFKHLFVPCVTIQYPTQRREVSEVYRGLQRLNIDENNREKCVGCGLCEKYCPAEAIKLITTVADEPTPEGYDKKVETYEIDISRCIFCGLCVEACPKDAIRMTGCYEMACYTRGDMMYTLDRLIKEPEITKYR